MKQNVGTIDRIFRLVAGIVLLSLVFLLDGDIRYVGLIGVIPILSAAFGRCCAYSLCKVDTACCKGEKKDGGSCCGGQACGPKDEPKEPHPNG